MTHSYLTRRVVPPPPTIVENANLMRLHFANLMRFRGERIAVLELRKRISWYAKNSAPLPNAQERMRMLASETEFLQIIREYLDWRLRTMNRSQPDASSPSAEAMPGRDWSRCRLISSTGETPVRTELPRNQAIAPRRVIVLGLRVPLYSCHVPLAVEFFPNS